MLLYVGIARIRLQEQGRPTGICEEPRLKTEENARSFRQVSRSRQFVEAPDSARGARIDKNTWSALASYR
jgi:hypothetical protein